MSIKHQLFQACLHGLDVKINFLQQEMKAAQEDAQQETKSTAGDKYETGRAMIHLELEKMAGQLNEMIRNRKVLDQIDPLKTNPTVQLGSVVITTQGNYFLSISAGTLKAEEKDFFCISPASPIGLLLVGKSKGDQFTFRHQPVTVLEIF